MEGDYICDNCHKDYGTTICHEDVTGMFNQFCTGCFHMKGKTLFELKGKCPVCKERKHTEPCILNKLELYYRIIGRFVMRVRFVKFVPLTNSDDVTIILKGKFDQIPEMTPLLKKEVEVSLPCEEKDSRTAIFAGIRDACIQICEQVEKELSDDIKILGEETKESDRPF